MENKNFKKVENIRGVQSVILDILIYFDKICKKHNLRYSLAYGTLIGAARHKGFIPWDDDIDVLMPSADYLKLLELEELYSTDARFRLHTDKTERLYNEKYIYPYAKLEDHNTEMVFYRNRDTGGAYIDIFPMTGLPKEKDICLAHWKKALELKRKISICGDRNPQKIKNIKNLAYRLFYKRLRQSLKKIVFKYPFNSSDKIGDTAWGNAIVPTNSFDNLIEMEFEGLNFSCFKEYDAILTRSYGDWRQLPPENERIPKHGYDLYIKAENR